MFAPLAAADLRARCLEWVICCNVLFRRLSRRASVRSFSCGVAWREGLLVLVPWVLPEAPLFELPHVVHGEQRRLALGPMLATGLDCPVTSIATLVHPSATASPMAVFTVCASWATLQVPGFPYGAIRCLLYL